MNLSTAWQGCRRGSETLTLISVFFPADRSGAGVGAGAGALSLVVNPLMSPPGSNGQCPARGHTGDPTESQPN